MTDNTKIRSSLLLWLVMLTMPLTVWSQETWEKEGEGEIKDVEIEIVKNRKITLPRASRNFEKVSPRPFEPIEPAITYELRGFRIQTAPYKPTLRPLKLKQEEITRSYGNYLSAGFGNYASLFGEAAFTTRRNKDGLLGAHLYHRSYGSGPVQSDFSASSATAIDVFGKRMWKDVTVSGLANWSNRGGYFYGYSAIPETDKSNIRQTYNLMAFQGGVENTRKGDFNYNLLARYSYTRDHYAASEGEFTIQFTTDAKVGEGKLLTSGDYVLMNRQDAAISPTSRNLLRFRPAYEFSPVDGMTLTLGANIALQNDQYPGSKDLHVYPNIKVNYKLTDEVSVFGYVTGDIDKVDLHTLSAENIWLNSNVSVYHTNRALDVNGGIRGRLGDRFAFTAGIGMATLKNLYFYLNVKDEINSSGNTVPVLFNKFNVTYDQSTQRINPYGELTYVHSDLLKFLLRGDYFSYQTESLAEAWHRPTYKVQLTARYNAYNKITVDGGIVAQGGMKGYDPGALNTTVHLDPALDLHLRARYFVSKQFSVFLQFDNMLGQKYPLYLSYPARGFQVLGGVSWAF